MRAWTHRTIRFSCFALQNLFCRAFMLVSKLSQWSSCACVKAWCNMIRRKQQFRPSKKKGQRREISPVQVRQQSQPSWMKVTLVTAAVGGAVQILVNHFDGIVAAGYALLIHILTILHSLIECLIPPGRDRRSGRRQAISFCCETANKA
jgi:hypothetical protein